MNKIKKIPRILATGFCFSYFFLGGFFISTCIFPFIYLLPISLKEKQKKVRGVIRRTFRGFVFLMEFLHLIKVRVHNKEMLMNAKEGLIVANHPTLIDVVILFSIIPQANCVVKGELFRNKYLKRVVSLAGFISNENGEKMINQAKESVQDQLPVLIFPEGSRSVPGQPLKFQRGTANIAVRTNAPLLTILITCNPITLTKGAAWYEVPKHCANIDIQVMQWIDSCEMAGGCEDPPAAARRLTKALQHYYEKSLKDYVDN